MLWTSLSATLMKREQNDWKQWFMRGTDKWVSAESREQRGEGGGGGGLMVARWSGNTPILQWLCSASPISPSFPPLHIPPSHLLPLTLTTFHVRKCFIISAFVVKSLRLEKKKSIHQWTSNARSLLSLSFYLSSTLASTPCFTHGWVWQVVFRSNDTLLLAGWGRTNTQGIACIMCHLI